MKSTEEDETSGLKEIDREIRIHYIYDDVVEIGLKIALIRSRKGLWMKIMMLKICAIIGKKRDT